MKTLNEIIVERLSVSEARDVDGIEILFRETMKALGKLEFSINKLDEEKYSDALSFIKDSYEAIEEAHQAFGMAE